MRAVPARPMRPARQVLNEKEAALRSEGRGSGIGAGGDQCRVGRLPSGLRSRRRRRGWPGGSPARV